jgi:hypothetical protein
MMEAWEAVTQHARVRMLTILVMEGVPRQLRRVLAILDSSSQLLTASQNAMMGK